MDDLIAFLRARIADSRARILELRARTAEDRGEDQPWTPEGHDPVMVDLDAKLRIIELHAHEVDKIPTSPFDPMTGNARPDEYEVICAVCGWASDDPTSACTTLRLLALPYADHPDFRGGWRP